MKTGTAPPESGLRRELGVIDAVGIGFGAIVGAGIFVVTGVAVADAGPAIIVALAIAGVAAALNALSSAQLAAKYPFSGGTYEYGYRLLNPTLGFAAGWLFLVSKLAAAGTVALGLAAYVDVLGANLPPRVIAAGAMIVFTAVNYIGLRRSSTVNLVIVAITLLSLLTLIVKGAGQVRSEHMTPFAPGGARGVLTASAMLFFAYTGYARVATLGEEVRDPERTIPRAIVITIVGAAVLYVAVAIVAVGAAGAERLSNAAPLAAAADAIGGARLRVLIAGAGIVAMLGVALSQLLGLSRMTFAMARRGDLWPALAAVHPRYQVPGRAVLLVGVIATVIALTGTLAGIANAASFAILLYYAIANLAALRMPADAKLFPDIVPACGLAACLMLAASLPLRTLLIGAVLLLAGLVWRALFLAWQRRSTRAHPEPDSLRD